MNAAYMAIPGIDKRAFRSKLARQGKMVNNDKPLVAKLDPDANKIEKIAKIVAGIYWIPVSDLTRRVRYKEIVEPRQVAEFFAVENRFSLSSVARFFNHRTHAVIYNSKKTVLNYMDTDRKRKDLFEQIDQLLKKTGI